jgi:hypothetical protein
MGESAIDLITFSWMDADVLIKGEYILTRGYFTIDAVQNTRIPHRGNLSTG